MISLFAKSIGSSAISGYAAHRLLSLPSLESLPLPRPARIALTGLASFAGFAYYAKVWIQDFYFDYSYNDDRDLTGRTAIVTGGTLGGLGFAAAELLYKQGATVVVTVRSEEKGELAVAKLKDSNTNTSDGVDDDDRASYVICDFLSEPSVRKCAAEIMSRCGNGIDFLVLNAGIASVSTSPTTAKKDAKDGDDADAEQEKKAELAAAKVWMTNHVGPFVFANELMPSLVQTAKRNPSEHPRVVWVSSGAHKKATIDWDNPFHPKGKNKGSMKVYGQSKLANVMHAREYQKRVRDCLQRESDNSSKADVKCFALTPGAVWTSLLNAPTLLYPLFWVVMRTPTKGAQVIKMACLDNELKGGEYLSNCCVKESQGKDGCSNDEEQWKRLWEVTEKQVAGKEYEAYL